MSGQQRNKYKIAGPQTWELVRAAYLSGDSAQAVAERYGVTVPAIRRRAGKEKWTKRDLAAALEARGIAPPPPPAAPDYIEPYVERAAQRLAADAGCETEMNALVEEIASETDAAHIAGALERRALAQASAAMVQGRSKEAQALAALAEMMRKRAASVPPPPPLMVERECVAPVSTPAELERRALAQVAAALERGDAGEARALTAVAEQMRRRADEDRATAQAAEEAAELDAEQRESLDMEFFVRVAHVASCMVHQPGSGPAAFLRLIKRWREINLGEGEADAEKRAMVIVEAQRRHLEGKWKETLPEDVRSYLDAQWQDVRLRLERNEPLGVVRKSELWGGKAE